MSDLDRQTLDHLTKLCHIHCSEEEQESFFADLKKILSYIELLEEVNTEHVSPCNHVLKNMTNVFRKDLPGETLSNEEFLSNAPNHTGGMIRVPPILSNTEAN